jgi:hypothetical protein
VPATVGQVLGRIFATLDDSLEWRTPLSAMVYESDLEAASLLVQSGCHPDRHYLSGIPLLAWSVSFSSLSMVRLLLESGADPNLAGNEKPWTVLNRAIERGNPSLVALLLDWGANPNGVDSNGISALDAAKRCRVKCIARMLSLSGATKATRSTAQVKSHTIDIFSTSTPVQLFDKNPATKSIEKVSVEPFNPSTHHANPSTLHPDPCE